MTTTQNTTAQVTITLTATAGNVQIIITRDGEVIATKATKDDVRLMKRVDAFLRESAVVREGFTTVDGVLVAAGVQML